MLFWQFYFTIILTTIQYICTVTLYPIFLFFFSLFLYFTNLLFHFFPFSSQSPPAATSSITGHHTTANHHHQSSLTTTQLTHHPTPFSITDHHPYIIFVPLSPACFSFAFCTYSRPPSPTTTTYDHPRARSGSHRRNQMNEADLVEFEE
jgi:hypothetical protein